MTRPRGAFGMTRAARSTDAAVAWSPETPPSNRSRSGGVPSTAISSYSSATAAFASKCRRTARPSVRRRLQRLQRAVAPASPAVGEARRHVVPPAGERPAERGGEQARGLLQPDVSEAPDVALRLPLGARQPHPDLALERHAPLRRVLHAPHRHRADAVRESMRARRAAHPSGSRGSRRSRRPCARPRAPPRRAPSAQLGVARVRERQLLARRDDVQSEAQRLLDMRRDRVEVRPGAVDEHAAVGPTRRRAPPRRNRGWSRPARPSAKSARGCPTISALTSTAPTTSTAGSSAAASAMSSPMGPSPCTMTGSGRSMRPSGGRRGAASSLDAARPTRHAGAWPTVVLAD